MKGNEEKIGAKWRNLPFGPNGAAVRITRTNLAIAQQWFGAWAASVVRHAGFADPVFIPIPNRNGTTGAADFKSAALARYAAAAFGAGGQAYTGLRFRAEVPKAAGERQSIADLVANMVLISPVPAGTLIIVDDVYTLGRHITAVAQVLPRKPAMVVTAARTVKEPTDSMTTAGVLTHFC